MKNRRMSDDIKFNSTLHSILRFFDTHEIELSPVKLTSSNGVKSTFFWLVIIEIVVISTYDVVY